MRSHRSARVGTRLRSRSLQQRQLIRGVIDQLAAALDEHREDGVAFGRIVRLVHTTAAFELDAHAVDDLARHRLAKRCLQRMAGSPTPATRIAA